jgi:hypothetical protein
VVAPQSIPVRIAPQAPPLVPVPEVQGLELEMQRRARFVRMLPVAPAAAVRGRDAWVSSILRTTDYATARSQAHLSLQRLIDDLAEAGKMAPEQRSRLWLAGEGDISRFLAECELFVSDALAAEALSTDELRAQFPELVQRALDLRLRYVSGLHGDGSLFQKLHRVTE